MFSIINRENNILSYFFRVLITNPITIVPIIPVTTTTILAGILVINKITDKAIINHIINMEYIFVARGIALFFWYCEMYLPKNLLLISLLYNLSFDLI